MKMDFSIAIHVVSSLCAKFFPDERNTFSFKETSTNYRTEYSARVFSIILFEFLHASSNLKYTTRGLLFFQCLLRVRADWLIFDRSLIVISGGGIQNSEGCVQALLLSHHRERACSQANSATA